MLKKKHTRRVLRPPVNDRLLQEITTRIVTHLRPEKIILFGSYAYGKPNKDSDMDLFIVKNTSASGAKRFAMVSKALYPRLIPMDFVVKTPREIKNRLAGFDPFIREVFSKGKVLYEKK